MLKPVGGMRLIASLRGAVSLSDPFYLTVSTAEITYKYLLNLLCFFHRPNREVNVAKVLTRGNGVDTMKRQQEASMTSSGVTANQANRDAQQPPTSVSLPSGDVFLPPWASAGVAY